MLLLLPPYNPDNDHAEEKGRFTIRKMRIVMGKNGRRNAQCSIGMNGFKIELHSKVC